MFDLIRDTALDADVHYMARNRAVYTLRNHIPSMSPLSPADIKMIKKSFGRWVDERSAMEKLGAKGMTTDGMVKAVLMVYKGLKDIYGETLVECLRDLLGQGVDDSKLVRRCCEVVGWDRLEEL